MHYNPTTIRGRSQKETLVKGLEMIGPFQSPSDRVLWILAHHGGKMKRSRLRASTGMRYAMLVPILEELVKEGRIRITADKHGDLISVQYI